MTPIFPSGRSTDVEIARSDVEEQDGVFLVTRPSRDAAPLLYESPHSGRSYPADFATRLSLDELRRAEDAYVDALVAGASAHGVVRLAALFPRAYIDPNREEDDLDPALLAEPWPGELRPGPKTALGIGLVRRLLTPDLPLFDRRLAVVEVKARIEHYWRPYQRRLHALVREGAERHGRLLVVQWHSMKSVGNAATPDGPGARRADVVLGDRHGRTAPASVVKRLGESFAQHGLSVAHNAPYAGTPVLAALTRLAPNVAAVQIELNRALYLDEAAVTPTAGFGPLAAVIDAVTRDLVAFVRAGW